MEIGRYNRLEMLRTTSVGAFLADGEGHEVLLPTKWIPEGAVVGERMDVFIYTDSEDRPIATTLRPHAVVGEFGLMRVNQVNDVGAFLDWGIEKDLFVPFREQRVRMQEGRSYVVYLYLDITTGRVAASNRLARFLDNDPLTVNERDEVQLIVYERTDLGHKVIINHRHTGLVYADEVTRPLHIGEKLNGYVRTIRPDGKVDVSLQPIGYAAVEPNSQRILDLMGRRKGFLPFTDRTDPDTIRHELGMSKKVFKKAVGLLYRQRRITLEDDGIRLLA